MKCDYCDYESIYPQNLKRHMKSHMKSSEISEINKAKSVKSPEINVKSVKSDMKSPEISDITSKSVKSVKSPEINKQPTLEHISDNIVRVDDHTNTDNDVLFDITDEVSRGARALNRVNKAIPQRKMRQLVDSNQDTGSKISAKTVIGMIAFVIGIYLIWHFRVELMSLITNLKQGESHNVNSYGFSIERY